MAKKTIFDFMRMKEKGEKITYMTAYDFYTAQLAEQAGIDMLLIGDSMGVALYGYNTMIPTTMDQIVVHSEAVRRGAPNTFIIGDLPFLSYETSVYDAIKNAGRLIKEAGVDAVKPEGGIEVVPQIKGITDAGILVQGHIGMTGQKLGKMGGFVMQGRKAEDAIKVLDDAKAIEEAGAFSTVLVGVPAEVAKLITDSVKMPVYGFGVGPYCDGQVMITSDMLGITKVFIPKFIKRYANLDKEIVKLLGKFVGDVKNNRFPDEGHFEKMEAGEEKKMKKLVKTS
jgi:3-methyl-2-oxobutanoate hydroxymethyltransferase